MTDLFAVALVRFEGTTKAVDARVALLGGLSMAIRLKSEGCGAGRNLSNDEACADGVSATGPRQAASPTVDKAMALAEKTADELIASVATEARAVTRSQVSDRTSHIHAPETRKCPCSTICSTV